MTRDEILSMQPGRELDAQIARTLFGWEHVADYGPNAFSDRVDMWFGVPPGYSFAMLGDEVHLPTICDHHLPRCSTSIADAWLVVEAMRAKGWLLILTNSENGVFDCTFYRPATHVEDSFTASFETAPHAICLAALLAMEGEQCQ